MQSWRKREGFSQSLGPEGIAIINLDDERLPGFAKGLAARQITYCR